MKENVLDVLVYLFQNFLDDDTAVRFDRDSMQTDLLDAGFPLTEIHKAFDWMDGLAARQGQSTSTVFSRAIRIYSDEEADKLDVECRGFLMYLEQLGILSAESRELVIDRAMALNEADFDADDLKWVVLMVLFSQPGQEDAYAWMENLVFENFTGYLN
ncbi:MAG: DUF494 domain-containing protein [Gammaproteobacteria bacterium]|nr:DUF494 domain-containing protein [Gammaproteobacteria bacterium]MCP5136711.1 DUF494 domain-containing protein [Gammaproteobacteria bacterium]